MKWKWTAIAAEMAAQRQTNGKSHVTESHVITHAPHAVEQKNPPALEKPKNTGTKRKISKKGEGYKSYESLKIPSWLREPMTEAEVETFMSRVDLFMRRGLTDKEAEELADRLLIRDREGCDLRGCPECAHGSAGRCAARRAAASRDAPVAYSKDVLSRCPRFKH